MEIRNHFFKSQIWFNKLSYKKIVLILFVASFFYILPVILANTFYIDDMNRTVEGYNWNRDGRFISSKLMHLLSNQSRVVYSLFPYSTIFSTFLLSLSGFILSYILGIRDKIQLTFSGLIIATCPFLLEILTYKFDCLPISLSIFCAVLPFIWYKHKIKFFITSFLFLFLIFGFYQTTALSYAIILCVFLIKDVWTNQYKQILINGSLALVSFVLAFLFYQFCLKQSGITMVDTQRSEFIFGNPDFYNLLKQRWNGFKDLLFSLIKSSYNISLIIACIAVVSGLGAFLYVKRNSNRTILNILLTVFLVLFIVLLAVSINLVVMEPRWSPRSLIGFSFVLLLLFYAVIQLPKKFQLTGYFAFLPLFFYSFVISSQLGIFLKNQDEYSDFIISMVAPEILKHNDLKLVIDGQIQYAPRNATVNYGTMPFIYKLAPLYENYSFYWGIIRMNKFGIMSNTYVFGEEREHVVSNKENLPIIQQNKYYTLRIQPPYALIEFH
ncbi:glucosyltransferase domain-containing protein [Flavobacterium dauae]|uniref:glucosyltransferase domain-containing protein n=1 Tax=Flavobacterium dauae TaxID=1563479 RepID=UPI00101B4A1B|nr:glucosyltransferase domain-containing protein [Flavobacterium dauae]WLD23445.1 glucosyltransferase domain-containing protein [Flavobacterium dauae]